MEAALWREAHQAHLDIVLLVRKGLRIIHGVAMAVVAVARQGTMHPMLPEMAVQTAALEEAAIQDPEELAKALQQESLAKLVLRYMQAEVAALKRVTWALEAQMDMAVLAVVRTALLTRATAILLLQTQAVAAEVLRGAM